MLKRNFLMAAVLSLGLTASFVVQADDIEFCVTGSNPCPAGDIAKLDIFDWSPDSALVKDVLPAAEGKAFVLYTHASMANFMLDGSVVDGKGLNGAGSNSKNTSFEITAIAVFPSKVDSVAGNTIVNSQVPGQTVFEIWIDEGSDSEGLSGFGYRNGKKILSGTISGATSNFTGTGGGAGNAMDQFGPDEWGIDSLKGIGGSNFNVHVTFQDPDYFITPIDTLRFNNSQILEFREADPSACFDNIGGGGCAAGATPIVGTGNGNNGGAGGTIPHVGIINGGLPPDGGPDLLLQVDANNSFLKPREGIGVAKCYFGKQVPPITEDNPRLPNPIARVTLNDQFASRVTDVRFLRGLCNPAGKNEPVDPNRTDHYSCYSITDVPGQGVFFPPSEVVFETQNFGQDKARLGSALELCIPAIKNGVGTIEGHGLKCYNVNRNEQQEFPSFTFDDQFDIAEDTPRDIKKLSRFCTPVGKDTPDPAPVETEDPGTWAHWACYDYVASPYTVFPLAERIPVNLEDMLIQDALGQDIIFTTEGERRFCEPARKLSFTP